MMCSLVMEDRSVARTVASRRLRRHYGSAAVSLLAVLLLAAPAAAQPSGSGTRFSAKVLDTGKVSQRLTVALNRSIIIESTVEVARADVVSGEIADVKPISPTQLLITGKSYGNTNVILWDKGDQQWVLELSVEVDLERFNAVLKKIDPQSDVQAYSVHGNIILTGRVSDAERADRMVELATLFLPTNETGETLRKVQNHLEIAGEQQVLLRCTVAEVSRKASRELSINGFLTGDNFKDGFLVNQLGNINPIDIGAAGSALVTSDIPFLTGIDGIPISPQTTLSLGFPRVQMQLFIRALADNSLASILAEPNLVAISGETASFLAGGEFPIPVPQGNQQVTIEFREFGVRLNFTPIVKGHQMIRLRVAPEVSELDFQAAVQIEGFLVPGLTSRAMETTVELGSGQTIAIAGLLSEQVRGLASRIPGIGDVPILGALFRSTQFQRSMTELVVLVTPEIVAPLDAHQKVVLPNADRIDPNDFELYAMGMLEGERAFGEGKSNGNSESGTPLATDPEEMSLHGPWGHSKDSEQ